MKSEVNIDKGTCLKTQSSGNEATICLGNTSGYIINKEDNTFSLIFMTGTQSPEFELTPLIEEELKKYYR